MQEITHSLENGRKTGGCLLMFGAGVIAIGIMLSVFQQFVGINVVLYYAPEIFKNLGASIDVALLQSIIVGVINLSFTVLAIMTVDKFDHKPLQIISALCMALGMFNLDTAFYTQAPSKCYYQCCSTSPRRIRDVLGSGLLGIAGGNLPQRHSRQSARHCCRRAVVG